MRYLLNAPVVSGFGTWRLSGPIPASDAAAWARRGFVSAVGHRSTALLLAELLHITVPPCRRRVAMQPGDEALVFMVLSRLAEGTVLGAGKLAGLPWQLALLVRLD